MLVHVLQYKQERQQYLIEYFLKENLHVVDTISYPRTLTLRKQLIDFAAEIVESKTLKK